MVLEDFFIGFVGGRKGYGLGLPLQPPGLEANKKLPYEGFSTVCATRLSAPDWDFLSYLLACTTQNWGILSHVCTSNSLRSQECRTQEN